MDLYGALQRRVVQDLRLIPLVFDVLQVRVTATEGLALIEKLDVIHTDRLLDAQAAEDGTAPAKD